MSSGVGFAFEIAVRMATTAAVVIGITLAVARLGPRFGGIVAGLPIILGPGFLFLCLEHEPPFIAAAAMANLAALAATLSFVAGYVLAAARLSAAPSVALAILCWLVVAWGVSFLPPGPLISFSSYLIASIVVIAIVRRQKIAAPDIRTPPGLLSLVARGVAAGGLVAVATTAATRVGPAFSGILMAFPIGFTVISLTLHQHYGPAVARLTLASATRGMACLAVFAFTQTWAMAWMPPLAAWFAAMGGAVATSAGILAFDRWRRRG